MTNEILASIESEINILKQARALLAGTSKGASRGGHHKVKRVMSADARARIGAAQKKRWAAWKKTKA